MIAKELVTKCDVCGEAGTDVLTYVVRQDGHTWEIDLDTEHAAPLVQLLDEHGRGTEGLRPVADNRSLERRIRNKPPME